MTSVCDPLDGSVVQNLLANVGRSLCLRPGERPAQTEARIQGMTHNTMGFRPRDGLEYMLSTMIVGHFEMIMDSMHDVFQGQFDVMKARTKSTIVAMDRSMITLVRELRVAQKRTLAKWAEDARRATEEAPAAQEEIPEPLADIDAAPPMVSEPEPEPAAAQPANPEPAQIVPVHTHEKPARTHAITRAGEEPEETSAPREADDETLEDHITAFQKAMAAVVATLAETQTPGGANMEAAAGD
jgi:hypothetical protein